METEDKAGPWEQVKLVARSATAPLRKKSDGCTSSPDFNFRHCCEDHDDDYANQTVPRKVADRKMRKCIQRKGYVILPWVYWGAVRVFGRWFWYGNNPS